MNRTNRLPPELKAQIAAQLNTRGNRVRLAATSKEWRNAVQYADRNRAASRQLIQQGDLKRALEAGIRAVQGSPTTLVRIQQQAGLPMYRLQHTASDMGFMVGTIPAKYNSASQWQLLPPETGLRALKALTPKSVRFIDVQLYHPEKVITQDRYLGGSEIQTIYPVVAPGDPGNRKPQFTRSVVAYTRNGRGTTNNHTVFGGEIVPIWCARGGGLNCVRPNRNK